MTSNETDEAAREACATALEEHWDAHLERKRAEYAYEFLRDMIQAGKIPVGGSPPEWDEIATKAVAIAFALSQAYCVRLTREAAMSVRCGRIDPKVLEQLL